MSIASRIEAIEGHITNDYQALSDIGADLTGVDKNIENIANVLADVYDEMPKVSGTGSNITLDGTRPGKMILDYNGETQQDSTTGKNKCSSVTKPSNANLKFFIDKPAQTFTISFTSNEALSGNSLYLEVDGTGYGNLGEITASANTRVTKTYTLSNENYQAIQSGTTIDLLLYKNGANFDIPTDAMVEDGSTATSFEPYTGGSPAPSPSYPFDIHNVSGDNTIEICGKNRLDNSIIKTNQGNYNVIDDTTIETGKRLTYTSTTSTSGRFVVYATMDLTNYVGKTIRFKCNYNSSSNNNANYLIGLCNFDGSNRSSKSTASASGDTLSFVIPELIGEQKYLELLLYVNSGGSTINQNDYVDFTNMILTIDDEDMTYEAYTGNSQLISLGVENLFDKDNVTTGYLTYLNGVDTASNWRITDYIKISPNTPYIMSGCVNGTGANPSRCYYDINKTFISGVKHSNNSTSFVDTSPNNAYYMRESIKEADLNTAMIEKGSKANSYSPYGASYIELNKISTYQDYIYKENDKWYHHKEIGKVVLDGSESWDIATATGFQAFVLNGAVNTSSLIGFSNYYKNFASSNWTYMQNNNFIVGRNNNQIIIRNDNISTTSDLETWLSTHNTIIYYVLDTPTDTEITDTTLLSQLETIKRSYNGVTNISQENNDLPFILDVSALKEWNNE